MKPQQAIGQRRLLRPIERVSQEMGRFLQRQLARLQLTDLEAHLLWHLRRAAVPASELQSAFGIQPSTLTGVVDRLEKRGFARRRVNPADRRSFVIELTPDGQRAASSVTAVIENFDEGVRRRVRAADLDGFFKVLDAIEKQVDAS